MINLAALFFCHAQDAIECYSINTVDSRVDSLFSFNFNKMYSVIRDNVAQGDNNIDRNFVYLLTFLTGIDCHTTNYSGFCYFTDIELKEWSDWYLKNKTKIEWENVQKAILILQKKTAITEEEQSFLISLKIE